MEMTAMTVISSSAPHDRRTPSRQATPQPIPGGHEPSPPAVTEVTSIVIPAFNEASSIGPLVADLAAAASWHEILVVDDGSIDDTGARASAAGARVIRHPYNKGNGAAIKTGIRQATGSRILIIDADGQHRPRDAERLVSQLDTYDLVVGARSSATQATLVRRAGNKVLNGIASYLTA